jgi:hypothetical protein
MLYRGIALVALWSIFGCDGWQPEVLRAAVTRNTVMPAFYEDHTFMINFQELPSGGEAATLANNKSVNTIYQSDPGIIGGGEFVSVINQIQGKGFNPLWNEVQVSGNECPLTAICAVPKQFTSEADIFAAEGTGPNQIHLVPTTEVYRCAVLGPAPKNENAR